MNVEAANDVDSKYRLNSRSIVSVRVRMGRHCVGVYSNICEVNLCRRVVL